MDSVKTWVKATGGVKLVHESDSTTAKVDDNGAVDACADLLSSIAGENNKLQRSLDSLKNIPHPKPSLKPIRATQKAVCPNASVHKDGTIDITVGKQKVKIPFTLDAWSIAGKAGYNLQLPKTEFEYTIQNVQVTAAPGNIPKWWQSLANNLLWIAVGALGMFILGIVKKVVTIGK